MWSLFPKIKTPLITLISLIGIMIGISGVFGEERKNEVGISVDFMGGATNQVEDKPAPSRGWISTGFIRFTRESN